MDPYLIKRILRRPWLSLCTIVITVLMCVLMGYLMHYRQTQEEKLLEAQQSLEIFCQLSNGQGTSTEALNAPREVLELFWGEDAPLAPYIRDLRMTKDFEFRAPDTGIPEWNPAHFAVTLRSMTGPDLWEWIDPAVGGIAPEYFVEDFWNSEDFICLVSEELYGQLETDTFDMEVHNPASGSQGRAKVTFTVAGTYPGAAAMVIIPFGTAQKLAELTTIRSCVDSLSFYVADNLRLDEMTEIAGEQFSPIDPLSTGKRFALLIRDEQYRATTAVLEQNIRRTGLLLPMVLLLGLGVGFLISFLATRNERRTYALMRTLGMNTRRLFISVLREQLVPVLLGGLAGYLVSGEMLPAAGFLLCYGMGCAACLIKSIRVPPTAILREQE